MLVLSVGGAACGDDATSGEPLSLEQRLSSRSQSVYPDAVSDLLARAPDSPIAVGHIFQTEPGSQEAFARFETAMATLRTRFGGRLVVETGVRGVLFGHPLSTHVWVEEFERTADYLAMIQSGAFEDAARLEHRATVSKTLVFGTGAFLPRPTQSFVRPDFADLSRAEAEQMIREGLSPDTKTDRSVLVEMLLEQNPDEFFMVNLLDFRDEALYPNGEYPGSTAEEADERYRAVSTPAIASRGGGPRHIVRIDGVLVGDNPNWELMPTVRYASVDALLDMSLDPEFQAAVIHKFASLAETEILYTRGYVE